jgi:hypothetical protein
MNRRGKRLTLGVMAVGLAVVIVLVIAHWGTVRDHVEAWHFQLTRETESMDPAPWDSGPPLVFAPAETVSWPALPAKAWHTADLAVTLGASGLRVLEQRFPRRAYVVIGGAEDREEQDLGAILDELENNAAQETMPAE